MAKIHLAYNDELYTPVSGEVWIVDADGTGQVKPVAMGTGGGGTLDHGALTGLGDDDHTQYLNTTRHNAIDAADHGSGAATDGHVLTADGAGGAAWEPAQAGASALDDLTDVTITTPTTGDLVRYNGTTWVNYPDSNYADTVHTHVESDITNLDHYTDTDANAAIDIRVNKTFVDALNVDADTLDGIDSTGFATSTHTHTSAGITDFAEAVSDQVGTMVIGNTETGIAVTYDDVDNTLDFILSFNNTSGGHAANHVITNAESAGVANTVARSDHNHLITIANFKDFFGTYLSGGTQTLINFTPVDLSGGAQVEWGLDVTVENDLSQYNNVTSNFQNATQVSSIIVADVDKAFIDALNVDADTLDGIDSTGFAISSHNHDTDYVNITGDTMTGHLQLDDAVVIFKDTAITTKEISIMPTFSTDTLRLASSQGMISLDVHLTGISAAPTATNEATSKYYVDNNFAATGHTHTESDITDLGAYPDATGQLANKVAETDGAGGWTFIDTPTGGGGHPHVNTVEISDGVAVQWEIDLEVDGTLSFNFVG